MNNATGGSTPMTSVSRILFVTDASSSAWPAVCLLAGALPLERYRATVATVGAAPSAAARDDLMLLAPHASLTALDLRDKLDLFCDRARPDVIHTTELALGDLAWSGPRVVSATAAPQSAATLASLVKPSSKLIGVGG